MSFLTNLKAVATGSVSADEGRTAAAAGGTALIGITTDPLYAGLTGLAATCLIKELRTPSNFAGVGGAAILGLTFGPIGGALATTALLMVNRAMIGMNSPEVEAIVEQMKQDAIAAAKAKASPAPSATVQ